MRAIAILMRTLFILLLLFVVEHKLWPGDVLGTPLARLTLGDLVKAFAEVAIGFSFGVFLIARLFAIPSKIEDSEDWQGWWVWFGFALIFFAVFPFAYIALEKKNIFGEYIAGASLSVMGWLIS